MATLPTNRTSSSTVTEHVDDHNTLHGRFNGVFAKVYRSAALNIANVTTTAVPWDAEELDPLGFHDNVTNPSRLTVPAGYAGYYLVGAGWNSTASIGAGKRLILQLYKNGTTDIVGGRAEVDGGAATSYGAPAVSVIVQLAAGDFVESNAYQDSGGNLALDTAHSGFWCVMIGAA